MYLRIYSNSCRNGKLHTSHTDSREFFENELHAKKDIEKTDIEIPVFLHDFFFLP